MDKDTAVIFCDGASKGNPGPGGWGAVVVFSDRVAEIGGGENATTNNRMEITGAVSALSFAKEKNGADVPVKIFTDSKYLINGATSWLFNWQKNGWQTKDKRDVLNRDLWEKLSELVSDFKIKWQYVPGHSGFVLNERVDEIASSFAEGRNPELFVGALADYSLRGEIEKAGSDAPEDIRAVKPYYISFAGGRISRHETWQECQSFVSGERGVRYKKVRSKAEEESAVRQWTER